MATESDLRDLLQHPDPEGRGAIDLDAVLSRARRRRRPRVIAAQALSSVALVGVLGTAVVVSLPRPAEEAAMIAEDTAGGAESQSQPFTDGDVQIGQDLLKASECGVEPAVPPTIGWTVEVLPLAVDPGEAAVRVTLGLDAPVPESGVATVEVLTIVADDVVVGHAFPAASVPIGPGAGDPAPWEPVTWDAVAPVVPCDDTAALPPGAYDVVVRIQYVADGSDGQAEPITGRLDDVEIG